MNKEYKLLLARKRAGLSQADLAERAGCSRALISMIETGRLIPRPTEAEAIARALNERAEHLFATVL